MAETKSIPLFFFSQEDLIANRNGEISPSQRKVLLQGALGGFLAFLVAGAVFFGLFLLASNADGKTTMTIGFELFLPWLFLSIWMFWLNYPNMGKKIVQKISGDVTFQPIKMGVQICVGKMKFPAVTNIPMELFVPSMKYHIYYLKKGHRILSFEKEE